LKRKQEGFCAAGYARGKGTFDSVLKTKYFIQTVKLQWPSQEVTVAL
jgi:hypothetical protein